MYLFYIELPPLHVHLTFIGSSIIGANGTLICEVQLVDRLVVTPTIYWEKQYQRYGQKILLNGSDPVLSDNILTSVLNLSALETSDAGLYTCTTRIVIENVHINISSYAQFELHINGICYLVTIRLLF